MAILRPQRLIFSAMYSFFRGEAESGLRKAPGPIFSRFLVILVWMGLRSKRPARCRNLRLRGWFLVLWWRFFEEKPNLASKFWWDFWSKFLDFFSNFLDFFSKFLPRGQNFLRGRVGERGLADGGGKNFQKNVWNFVKDFWGPKLGFYIAKGAEILEAS